MEGKEEPEVKDRIVFVYFEYPNPCAAQQAIKFMSNWGIYRSDCAMVWHFGTNGNPCVVEMDFYRINGYSPNLICCAGDLVSIGNATGATRITHEHKTLWSCQT